MIGQTFTRKPAHGGGTYRVVAQDHQTPARWTVQRLDEFSSPLALTAEELRKQFVKATDVAAPPAQDHPAGYSAADWSALSAEAKLNAYAMAAEEGTVQEGEPLYQPNVKGKQVPATTPIDEGTVRALKGRARLLRRGTGKMPTPEETFADPVKAAADRIWNTPDMLAGFELGTVEVDREVAEELDRRIEARNRRSA